MDWIKKRYQYVAEKIHKIKDIKNLSLRWSLVIYIIIGVLAVLLCYLCTYTILQNWILMIREKYSLVQEGYYLDYGYLDYGYVQDAVTTQEKGQNAVWLIQMIQRFCMVPYMVVASIAVARIYFKNKLAEPLWILRQEALCIAREDYEFSCRYESNDEMSEICDTFEKMRLQLIHNQDNIADLMEEQRKLNAAFAHDIRTPLTVMSGYVEMLMSNDMATVNDQGMLTEMLYSIQKQIDRLHDFSNTMYKLQSLEMRKVDRKRKELSDLTRQIQENLFGLENKTDVMMQWKDCLTVEQKGFYDERLILEVLDNLLSNAMRYAVKAIEIRLQSEGGMLLLYVKDDGKGFSNQEIEKAARPYYTGESKNAHFGLGLTICKTLCKKHGGDLELFNSIHGGAIVCASFFVF